MAFLANLKEFTPLNYYLLFNFFLSENWLYKSLSVYLVLGTIIPSENSKFIIIYERAPFKIILFNFNLFSLVKNFNFLLKSLPLNVKSIYI